MGSRRPRGPSRRGSGATRARGSICDCACPPRSSTPSRPRGRHFGSIYPLCEDFTARSFRAHHLELELSERQLDGTRSRSFEGGSEPILVEIDGAFKMAKNDQDEDPFRLDPSDGSDKRHGLAESLRSCSDPTRRPSTQLYRAHRGCRIPSSPGVGWQLAPAVKFAHQVIRELLALVVPPAVIPVRSDARCEIHEPVTRR